MKFKEIFDKEILNEQYVRKELKIIYEFKLDLYKQEESSENDNQTAQQQVQLPQQQEVPQLNPEQPVQEVPNTPEPAPEQPTQNVEQEPQNNPAQETENALKKALSSVVTEEDKAAVNNDNKIMRSFEGEIKLTDSQKDNIQSFEDIIEVISNTKKDGVEIIDDFCSEIITLCANQQFEQIKQKLDKKSKIWIEIYYGYNKDDSVGLRFSKRQNSDLLTSTMLVDNEIVSAKFDINKINQKIAEYRNYDVKKSK